ncbi:MAG TPA: rhomboid family intramembrane serine protease [Streptomyces sp.]|nr:rhomboid family intramembrane serine protease [Streptomyces sp.]
MLKKVLPALSGVRAATAGGRPVVTQSLIGLCCLVFVLGPASGLNPVHGTGDLLLAAQSDHFRRWGVIPQELLDGSPRALLTPLTALFIHGTWLHLLGNMLFLYVFGGMAEARLGRIRYTLLYAGTGYLGLLAFAAAHAASTETLVGASGAISGVLGAFLLLFPKARVTSLFPFLFFLPLRFPAWVVLPFWFGLQWLGSRTETTEPGVAHLAHLVGFLTGFLCAWACSGGAARVSSAARATEGDSKP